MDYKVVGAALTEAVKAYNFQVGPKAIGGKPGKNIKNMREYRLQLINKHDDTSDKLKADLKGILEKTFGGAISHLKFNPVSPNSSKYCSYSFELTNQMYDVVIARGANKGENFEVVTTNNLAAAFHTRGGTTEFHKLIEQLNNAHDGFEQVEISKVEQRKGSTRKTGVPLERLGEVIGDIILTDENNGKWFVSLKDINGITFSAFPGGGTLFDKQGNLQPRSDGAKFLQAFGVDLAKVQEGFDERRGSIENANNREDIPTGGRPDLAKIKALFEQAWGMNYFYVRKKSFGWEVFWLDRAMLTKLASNIRVDEIRYPSKKSKSIMILCTNQYKKYKVEMRNSAGKEYPNDIKFSVR
jgi:hypothetical protein